MLRQGQWEAKNTDQSVARIIDKAFRVFGKPIDSIAKKYGEL
jgi:hypothetical protein